MGSRSPENHPKQELDDSGYVQEDGTTKEPPAAEAKSPACLLDFSDDVLLCILQYCTPLELKAVGYTCTRLGTLILDRTLWLNVDGRGVPTGQNRMRWLLTHSLNAHTNSLKLNGYAREAKGCLGYMSGSSFDTPVQTPPPCSSPEEIHPWNLWHREALENELTGPRLLRLCAQALPRFSGGLACSPEQSRSNGAPRRDPAAPSGRFCPGPQVTLTQAAMRRLSSLCSNLTELVLEYIILDCNMTKLNIFPKSLRVLSLLGSKCFNLDKSYLSKIQDHLVYLEKLTLSECDWVEPSCMLPLSKLPHLTALYMRHCAKMTEFVAYASLATRYGFKQLKVLDMRGSPVGDSEVSALGWVPLLEELYLSPARAAPNSSAHAHFSLDPAPEHSEFEAWEAEEPEYYKAKYETESWVKEERTRPELGRFGGECGIGSCVMLEHVGGPGTDPAGENLPKAPPPGEQTKAWSKDTLTKMGYAISKNGMRRSMNMYRDADFDPGEASSDEEEESVNQAKAIADHGEGSEDRGKGSADQEKESVDQGEGSVNQEKGSLNQVKGSVGQGKGSSDQGKGSANQEKRSLDQVKGSVGQGEGSSDQGKGSANQEKVTLDQVKVSVGQGEGSSDQGKGSANQEKGNLVQVKGSVGQGEGSSDHGKGSANQGDNSQKDNYKPAGEGFKKRKLDDDDDGSIACMRKWMMPGRRSLFESKGKKKRVEEESSSSNDSSNNSFSAFAPFFNIQPSTKVSYANDASSSNCKPSSEIIESSSELIEPSFSVSASSSSASEPTILVSEPNSLPNQPNRSIDLSLNESSSSMNEPNDLNDSNHKINRDVPTKGSRKHFDGTHSPDPRPLPDSDLKNGSGTGPKDKSLGSDDDSSDSDDDSPRRKRSRCGTGVIIADTSNYNKSDPIVSSFLTLMRQQEPGSNSGPSGSLTSNRGPESSTRSFTFTRRPQQSTSSRTYENMSTSSEPNQSTSSQPNPSSSSQPNPSTSKEPNPSTSRNPNPSTSQPSMPSTIQVNQRQGYVQFSRDRPPVFVESYNQPPQAMQGSTTNPATRDSNPAIVINCRNHPATPLIINPGPSQRLQMQAHANPVVIDGHTNQQAGVRHRECQGDEDHGSPIVIEGCSQHIIMGPCSHDDNHNVHNNNDAQQPDWNNRHNPAGEGPSQETILPQNFYPYAQRADGNEHARQRLLYVNVGRRRHAMYQVTMPEPVDLRTQRSLTAEMNLIYSSHVTPRLEYTSLITDAAIRRFGRADDDNINYVQIGPMGPVPAPYDDPYARPNRSNLRILSVTGFRHITNHSLTHLATAAPHLESVDFTGTAVTQEGVENFRNFRPDCRVRYGPVETPKKDSGRPDSR